MGPEDGGHEELSRARCYFFIYHKVHATCLVCPLTLYNKVTRTIQRSKVPTTPDDTMIATYEEIMFEAARLSQLRHIDFKPNITDLSYLLNDRERLACRYYDTAYAERFGVSPHLVKDLIYYLGDNPWSRLTWSAVTGRTYIKLLEMHACLFNFHTSCICKLHDCT